MKTKQLQTIYRIIDKTVDPLAYLNNLKSKDHVFLLESADVVKKSGEKSIGCVDPCLKITIKDSRFNIISLNDSGKYFIDELKKEFDFAKDLKITDKNISGKIKTEKKLIDEDERLKQISVFDVLRITNKKFQPKISLNIPFVGLFGMISYDAVDYFEELEKQSSDIPDLEFYFGDKLFVIDHMMNKTYIIVNFIDKDNEKYRSKDTLHDYEKVFQKTGDYKVEDTKICSKVNISVSDKDFKENVKKIKDHINKGDIFQCVISRTFNKKIKEEHLNIYARIKSLNPSPYMFYFENPDFTLLGASPETCLKVDNNIVEIKPIAGTLPRSKDKELDSRYELDLLLSEKELAEHCMLIDLARNDLAKVSVPGTRYTPSLLKIEKYSHVQHLVSSVKGKLRPGLDALHAYVATMNMGTLTGAPKIKAMQLIRRYEKDKRDFYGGAVGYMTPEGNFDSCIVIRSIMVKEDVASVRAGAGIVYDSDEDKECEETKRKARPCLKVLGVEE